MVKGLCLGVLSVLFLEAFLGSESFKFFDLFIGCEEELLLCFGAPFALHSSDFLLHGSFSSFHFFGGVSVDKVGGLGFAIFLVLCLLAIVVVVLFVFLYGKPEVKKVDVNVSANVSFFNITVSSNALDKVSYELTNVSYVLVDGLLFPSLVEEFKGGVAENSSVFLSAWGDLYYFNKTECNVSKEMFGCVVNQKRKAARYTVNLSRSELVIDTHGDGVVQSPVKVCFTERSNVANVLMDLPSASKPLGFEKLVDFCYSIDSDISGVIYLPIDVHKNEFNNVTDLLKVLVFDFENTDYGSAIGVREAAVLV